MINRILFSIVIPIFLFSQSKTITLKDCIEFAIKNNPQIRISEGNFEASEANLSITRASLFPQINFLTTGVKNGGVFINGPIVRTGENENYSFGFQAQQMIFDFWKTYSKISASSEIAKAAEQDFIREKQDIILNTTIAYFNLLLTYKLLELNEEIVKQSEEHLKQAKAFFDVGKRPQFDVVKAEADLANANLNQIKSKNSVLLNRILLENIIGMKIEEGAKIEDCLETFIEQEISYEKALKAALESRPELLSSKSRVEANKSLVTSAWSANLPTISATGSYNWRSPNIEEQFAKSWNINLNFSLPIFQGGALGAGIELARANLKSSEASYESALQLITLDVQQQYLLLQESNQRIDAAKKLVKQAEDAFKLADGRYNSEIGSAIEITDARVTLLNARVSYIQAIYDHQIAVAKLKRAMGVNY